MDKERILFLCVGNSCRSQMAEAIINDRMGAQWQASSAGSHPEGYVHPLAIKALAEIGIDHQGRSKSIEEFRGQSFDLVAILCDQDDQCPVWLGRGKVIHHPFPDPFKAGGTEAQRLEAYRSVRDQMLSEIPAILENFSPMGE